MYRKVVGAAVVLAICVGVAVAEDISGRITKIDGSKLTFEAKGKDKGQFEAPKEYELAKDAKVSKKGKGGVNEAVAEGLKAEALSKIGKKGVTATISVNGGKVTEIILSGKKKKVD